MTAIARIAATGTAAVAASVRQAMATVAAVRIMKAVKGTESSPVAKTRKAVTST
jgi:hypothetical protein